MHAWTSCLKVLKYQTHGARVCLHHGMNHGIMPWFMPWRHALAPIRDFFRLQLKQTARVAYTHVCAICSIPVSRYILSPRFSIRPDRISYPAGYFILGYFIRAQDILSRMFYPRIFYPGCFILCVTSIFRVSVVPSACGYTRISRHVPRLSESTVVLSI